MAQIPNLINECHKATSLSAGKIKCEILINCHYIRKYVPSGSAKYLDFLLRINLLVCIV